MTQVTIEEREEKLLAKYIKLLCWVQLEIMDLHYHIEETIDDIERLKANKSYEGAFLWTPDTLMGHSYRILSKLKEVSDIYQEDYTEWKMK